jgi:hypothetical protein
MAGNGLYDFPILLEFDFAIRKPIVSKSTKAHIVSVTSSQIIISTTAQNTVISAGAIHGILASTTNDQVISRGTNDRPVASDDVGQVGGPTGSRVVILAYGLSSGQTIRP